MKVFPDAQSVRTCGFVFLALAIAELVASAFVDYLIPHMELTVGAAILLAMAGLHEDDAA